jgi:lysozyme
LKWIGLLLFGAVEIAGATALGVPASGQGCTVGWDQLLTAEQRVQASVPRDCQASSIDAPKPDATTDMQTTSFLRGSQAPRLITMPDQQKQHVRALSSRSALKSRRVKTALNKSDESGKSARVGAPGSGVMPIVLAPLIDRVAQAHDIDPLLLHAIARVESRHQPGAVSTAGAHGLMQVIVPTARRFGVDDAGQLHDPLTNLKVSARYLKSIQLRLGNDLRLVLAAYNAGEGAVERYGRRVPPYRETQDYVRKVLAEYGLLLQVSRQQSAAAAWSRARFGAEL